MQRVGHVRNAMGPACAAIATVTTLVASRADVALWCAILAVHCGRIGITCNWLVVDHGRANSDYKIARDYATACKVLLNEFSFSCG